MSFLFQFSSHSFVLVSTDAVMVAFEVYRELWLISGWKVQISSSMAFSSSNFHFWSSFL